MFNKKVLSSCQTKRRTILPNNVAVALELGRRFDNKVCEPSFLFLGPVLVTDFSTFLLIFCQHDDHGHIVLPNHAPEIVSGALQGCLCSDVAGSLL